MSFRANSTVRNLFKIGRNLRRQNSYKNISINYSLKDLFEKVDKSMDSKMSTLEKNLKSDISLVSGDVKSVEKNLKSEISLVGGDVKSVEKNLKSEISLVGGDVKSVEKNLKSEISLVGGDVKSVEKNLSSEIVVVNGEVKSVKYIIGSIVLVFFSTFVGAVGKYVIDNWLNKKTIEQPPPPLPNKDHEIIRKMRELLHEEKN
ncbi:hypothetical protein Mgra_00000761 [Meloidogyne graminicola]|uniref:Uncharacterized protein n=1 Tax=Meloidogyne graminicola TaxID=189291 RepID=A0A8T0A1A3_9BILA|nr:hypothetical protein Mgra_00000761 [Meloidogyne graminicola]